MRVYLYILSGITSSLIGWNIGQFFLADLNFFAYNPEVVLFPCVATALAIGMVINEIFLSNPTRPKLNLRAAKIPVLIASSVGLIVGLLIGVVSQALFLPQLPIPTSIVRVLGWLLIGLTVGLSEGLAWQWYSLEAGDRQRAQARFKTSLLAGGLAGLTAAVSFEVIRIFTDQLSAELRAIEDPIGFSLLGAILGFAFSISTSPSYTTALRAGGGFEYVEKYFGNNQHKQSFIDRTLLKFISNGDLEEIEEGLSIQLPKEGKISIGSSGKSHICIPQLPDHVADLQIQLRSTKLVPNIEYIKHVEINGLPITSRKFITLRHNTILTFRTFHFSSKSDHEEVFRFVYYNRFLDPEA